MDAEYFSDPTPHVYVRQLVDPMLYAQATFPELEARPLGRIGRDLYQSDSDFYEVMSSNGWEPIRDYVTSKAFVGTLLDYFAADLPISDWSLDPYYETRKETESGDLKSPKPPGALFTRFDFQATGIDYVKPPHVDWPRRLVGGVIFCCDAKEEGLEGGEFGLYADADSTSPPRICRQPILRKSYPVRHNTAIFFLNSNTGFHGPTPITKLSGQRRWIYYSISSRRNIWS